MNTLIDQIEFEMGVDESNKDIRSKRLIALVESASYDELLAIDATLICICGWGYQALLDRS